MYGGTDGAGEPLYGMAPIESEPAEIERKPHESGNVFTHLVDSGASGHVFDDPIVPELKDCLQDYTPLSAPRTVRTAGGALLDDTAKGALEGLTTNDCGEQHLARIAILIMSGIGLNFFSVKRQQERAPFRFSMPTTPGWRWPTLLCHFTKKTTVSTPSI